MPLRGQDTAVRKTLRIVRNELQTILSLCEEKQVHAAVRRIDLLIDALEAGLRCPMEEECPLAIKRKLGDAE